MKALANEAFKEMSDALGWLPNMVFLTNSAVAAVISKMTMAKSINDARMFWRD